MCDWDWMDASTKTDVASGRGAGRSVATMRVANLVEARRTNRIWSPAVGAVWTGSGVLCLLTRAAVGGRE